jgi:HD-like signal output (HDOD) protein
MHKVKLQEARDFLEELAENPPLIPYEPSLLPLFFAATREGSTASIDDLAALVERSQKLATRVLSLANSALYALESTVTSLHRAISILGFREIRTLIIMIGAVSAIKAAKLPKGFDATALWRHQLKTAAVAKVLAGAMASGAGLKNAAPEQRFEMAPDEAYAAGLLHDIGKVFLAAGRPHLWGAIEEIRQISSLSFFEAEDEYWGMDHALIGAQVLHYWKLPLLLTDPINWHHAPDLAPALGIEARLLAAANRIAHSGLTEENALRADALSLMPEGADALVLGAAVKAGLEKADSETLVGLIR